MVRRFVVKRLLIAVLQLIGISIVVFFMIRLLPADPVARLVGFNASEEAVKQATEGLGLHYSSGQQLLNYIGIFSVTGEQAGASTSFVLVLTQDGVGGRTVDLTNFVGRTVKWAGGVVPTVSTNPNAIDIFLFTTFTGGTIYHGFTSGQEF